MSALNASNLLATWEQGVSQHPLERAVRLLHLAWPEKSVTEWAKVSVGERDRQLLRLREHLFGPNVETTARCPKCSSELELTFTARDLECKAAEPLANEMLQLVSGDYEIGYRLPTTADLLEIAKGSGKPLEVLLDRCIVASRKGRPVKSTDLPAAVIDVVSTRMAETDPYAEIEIGMDCAGCSLRWSMVFDVVSYFWSEIEDWAERLLRDVHLLASAYGWSEHEIVEMSARRRRMYLELVHI